MTTTVMILGAGFGGLELASTLSERLAGEVDVTLFDQHDAFVFGFSKLEVLFGHQNAEQVRIPYREIRTPGVEFRQERVLAIDPGTRHVVTDAAVYDPDIVVVALGADYDIGRDTRLRRRRVRVLHGRRRRAVARRTGGVPRRQGDAGRALHPVQVPARAVRGDPAAPRPARRPRHPRLDPCAPTRAPTRSTSS